ncbi:hypothetical protein RCH23_000432 [Cryobacterium sp. CAN_C3]|nr:hypothetical protein [Cryobacterium sp. CAN_C3]
MQYRGEPPRSVDRGTVFSLGRLHPQHARLPVVLQVDAAQRAGALPDHRSDGDKIVCASMARARAGETVAGRPCEVSMRLYPARRHSAVHRKGIARLDPKSGDDDGPGGSLRLSG